MLLSRIIGVRVALTPLLTLGSADPLTPRLRRHSASDYSTLSVQWRNTTNVGELKRETRTSIMQYMDDFTLSVFGVGSTVGACRGLGVTISEFYVLCDALS